MKQLLITTVLIISSFICQAQIKLISEQTYDAGALYGYMNGGSELYKEYEFQTLTVQELEVDGQVLKFECFEMARPIMAFGIFSVNTYQCQSDVNKLLPHSCASDYQLQAAYGNWYLSIINNSGQKAAQAAANKVLRNFINNHSIQNDSLLPKHIGQLHPDRIMYMNGLLAMENRAAQWTDVYQQLGINDCFILQWKASKASVLVIKADNHMKNKSIAKNSLMKVKKGVAYIALKGYDDDFIKQLFKQL
ncbi:DUF6599 family protein [Carboxylicivirga taeanensis]|uniref:DUF6599 family protein n=1 Tax=Carboxylicivirga taeanensis TaxID=1416875 RepID=UPI003F6DC99D